MPQSFSFLFQQHTHPQVKHEPPLVLTFSFFCRCSWVTIKLKWESFKVFQPHMLYNFQHVTECVYIQEFILFMVVLMARGRVHHSYSFWISICYLFSFFFSLLPRADFNIKKRDLLSKMLCSSVRQETFFALGECGNCLLLAVAEWLWLLLNLRVYIL